MSKPNKGKAVEVEGTCPSCHGVLGFRGSECRAGRTFECPSCGRGLAMVDMSVHSERTVVSLEMLEPHELRGIVAHACGQILVQADDQTVCITEHLIKAGSNGGCGWNRRQLAVLGVPWPLEAGWMHSIIGKSVPTSVANRFLAMRKRKKPRKPEFPPMLFDDGPQSLVSAGEMDLGGSATADAAGCGANKTEEGGVR
jgi:hypothetical protein